MQTHRTNSRVSIWQLAILCVCLCVFLFGLQAKLSLYQPGATTATPTTAGKLWMGDQKMDLPGAHNVLMSGLLLACLFFVCVPVTLSLLPFYQSRPPQACGFDRSLFIRPPPVR
jgi:hypothetical protein